MVQIMISFKEFLLESEDPKHIAETIKRDCSNFLLELHGVIPVYRGQNVPTVFKKYTVNKNRQPKNLNQEIHAALDEAFEKMTGIRYRSESVFASGCKKTAKEYGRPCLFFPKGKYEYIWSPIINDPFEWFNLAKSSYAVKDGYIEYSPLHESQYLEDIKNFIISGEANYEHNTNLREAILSLNEIMFYCNNYYLLPIDDNMKQVAEEVIMLLNQK